ncbi:VWA domain-containing protein [Nostocoides veronense]|uniref:VWA domain-containing protein n=1 Tax=Nostocoides veronense TaxID=330836 RepID=A0ABN2LM24_9MICO
MAQFTAEAFQNQYLADGATDVHAIVRIDATGAASTMTSSGGAAEVIIVDTSGSMGERGIREGAAAATAALQEIADGTAFAVIAGNHLAWQVYPTSPVPGTASMNPQTRAAAINAVRGFRADGGTAMGQWLLAARQVFLTVPDTYRKHAILLTDGANEHETPDQLTWAIQSCMGAYQADCRGVGDRWQVDEVRRIASALLGTVDLIPRPEEMSEEFRSLMRASMSRGIANAELRVWAPAGAQVLFVKQVSPNLEDLTSRRREVNPLTGAYPTGAWSDESRDYHVAVRLPAKSVGQEQLAARVQLAIGEEVQAQALVKALWSNDDALTARINPQVAQYTGQAELAAAIQDGLAAKAAGRDDEATSKLGRAVQLATQSGNEEMTTRLKKVVEIDNAETGTVRLKKQVEKLDEMALDTASTKTQRVRK